MKTEHGYDVVEFFKIEENRFLVRVVRFGHLHNHVTWQMNHEGKCSDGEYYGSEEQAIKGFERRKQAFMGM